MIEYDLCIEYFNLFWYSRTVSNQVIINLLHLIVCLNKLYLGVIERIESVTLVYVYSSYF